MQNLNIQFENCYGIKNLKADLDFSKNHTIAIYAPNGAMKTSFSKTFQDISKKQSTSDRIFKDRTTLRAVKNETGKEISSENIFVIEPFNDLFKSEKISTLLANNELKTEFERIESELENKKDMLLSELKSQSGVKKDIEDIFSEDIMQVRNEFFAGLSRLKDEVNDNNFEVFSEISYQKIFNSKTTTLLADKDFLQKIEAYIKIYDTLIGKSTFFRKGIFNHFNASEMAKSLKNNGFFKANHSVFINRDNDKREVSTEADLEALILAEKKSILDSKELVASFDEVDKKFSTIDLRELREYLEENKFILPELANLSRFKSKLWIAYLAKSKVAYQNLIDGYNSSKEARRVIMQKAKDEAGTWIEVVRIFNERFSVPFEVKVENQIDVILKNDVPTIAFDFVDLNTKAEVKEKDLFTILSNGEKRALYLLNIIYEIEARKHSKIETIFVIDDIADSFDYKNKYAIVQYLKEISTADFFYQIILSHNFDFYRTISSRLELPDTNRLHTSKNESSVSLNKEKYQFNPFKTWKKSMNKNNEMLIAMIPFVRNLAEYCGHDESYKKLTSLLHLKSDSNSILLSDIEVIFNQILKQNSVAIKSIDPSKSVLSLIHEVCLSISDDKTETVDLEKKVALSIGIRLKTEEYLITAINDPVFLTEIEKNQTPVLVEKYKSLFPNKKNVIRILEQVNLMTPENIHINSFMYEPILDMSDIHLKSLYKKVVALA